MEPYFPESIINQLKDVGFTYYHGIDERTSIFYNKITGKFLTHKRIESILRNSNANDDLLVEIDMDNVSEKENYEAKKFKISSP